MLVNDQSHLGMALLEGANQLIQGHDLGDKQGFPHERTEVLDRWRLPRGLKQVLQMQNADHVIDIPLIRRQTGVDGLGGSVQHLLNGLGEINRHHIEARNHDIGHMQVCNLCPMLHHLPLEVFQECPLDDFV